MYNYCIVITTCKQYFSNITNLINQINELKLPKDKILIVSGQENEEEILFNDNIKIIKVKYTGLHHTGAIYINENIKDFNDVKYWVLLPDTIKFGNNFLNNIHKYYDDFLQSEEIQVLGFINPRIRASMDICIVHTNHIINFSDYLSKIKTYQVDPINLLKLKKVLIYDENTIIGTGPITNKGTNYDKKVDGKLIKFVTNELKLLEQKVIENGKINQVYFILLDLYKFQRNFKGPDTKLIMNL